jgi:transposase InsO family protein
VSRYRFIAAAAGHHPVALSCRVLGGSRAGFSAWQGRPPSARARADAELTAVIHRLPRERRGTSGAPRIHADLRAAGRRHGRKRVARLMRTAGLPGCHRRRRRPRTTVADPAAAPAPNRVQRDCSPLAPQPGSERDQVREVGTGRGREPPVESVGQPPLDDLHELLEQRVGRRRRARRLQAPQRGQV